MTPSSSHHEWECGNRELLDAGHDVSLQLVTVLNELLDAVLVETRVLERSLSGRLRRSVGTASSVRL